MLNILCYENTREKEKIRWGRNKGKKGTVRNTKTAQMKKNETKHEIVVKGSYSSENKIEISQ